MEEVREKPRHFYLVKDKVPKQLSGRNIRLCVIARAIKMLEIDTN
jgi:hypothetical protein